MILNVAVALSKLPSDPVAVTVYAVDDAVPVIVTPQLNAPVPFAVALHSETPAPALIVSATVAPGVKPVPVTDTDAPLGPCAGLSVIE